MSKSIKKAAPKAASNTYSMLLNKEQYRKTSQALHNAREVSAYLGGYAIGCENVADMHALADEPDTKHINHLMLQSAEMRAQQALLATTIATLNALLFDLHTPEADDSFVMDVETVGGAA